MTNIFGLFNEILADYNTFRAILTMSIAGGLIAALIFMMKPFVKSRLPKSAQYYLWLVVIATLLVPFSRFIRLPVAMRETNIPTIHYTVEQYFATNAEISERLDAIEKQYGYNEELIDAAVPPVWWQEAQDWLHIGWFIGTFAFLMITLTSYVIFTGKLKLRNAPASTDELAMFSKLVGNKRVPRLYRNTLAATPMLIGLLNPAIILPDREYTDAQLRTVLLHELTHLRRKDVLVKWLSILAGAVHWFNPLVYIVRAEIDRACELSCDEAVIRDLNTDGKQSYGDTLIYVAANSKTPRAVLSTTMCDEKNDLKERLEAIMKSKKHTRAAIIISAALIIAVAGTAIALGAGQGGKDNRIFFRGDEEQIIAGFDALRTSDYADITVKLSETTRFIEYMISVNNDGTGTEEKLIKIGETLTFIVGGYNSTTVKAKAIGDGIGGSYATFEVTQTKSEAESDDPEIALYEYQYQSNNVIYPHSGYDVNGDISLETPPSEAVDTGRDKPVEMPVAIFSLDEDNGKIALYPNAIDTMTANYVIEGRLNERSMDNAAIADLAIWLDGLIFEKVEIQAGQTPTDSEGGEIYLFNANDTIDLFTYGKYVDSE
ncbi:MAG: M56 family metallopeptidase, partial [Clostridiales bacterium]|nr:M56 family metallopeptidase [Clostridiales bacterium]